MPFPSNVAISNYVVSFIGSPCAKKGNWRARIDLQGEGGASASIEFYDTDADSLPNDLEVQGRPVMILPLTTYPAIIDLLRNEKPVYVRTIQLNNQRVILSTAAEPVGENEAAPVIRRGT